MAVFTETIKLEDQVSPAAKAAASETKTLTSALDAVNKSLVKAGALGDVQGFRKLTAQAGALKSALGQVDQSLLKESQAAKSADAANAAAAKAMKQAEDDKAKVSAAATQQQIANNTKLTNVMGAVKDAVSTSVAGIKAAFTSLAAGDVKGAIAGVTESVAGIAKLLDLAVPGLGQAVSAIVSIAGGLVGVTAGLIQSMAEFAVSASEAKTAALSVWDALGEGAIAGKDIDDMLDGLKAKLGITKDQLGTFATAFLKMGITSQEALERLTTAAASAEAITKGAGEGFAKLFQKVDAASQTTAGKIVLPAKGLQKALVAAGLNIDDMSKALRLSAAEFSAQMAKGGIDAKKFGDAMQKAITEKGAGALEKLANSSANLKKILQENIGDMFEDLSDIVAPFMKEVKDLFAIFQKDAPSAKTATAAIRGVLTQVFGVLTKIVPMVKHFLLDMVIYALKAYIAVQPIVKAIKEFAASARGAMIISVVLSSLWTVLKAIGVIVAVVVVAVLALWAAMIVVSTVVWTLIGGFIALITDGFGGCIKGTIEVGEAILAFVSGAMAALDDWTGGALTAAKNFVQGLVDGIVGGASAVIGAVTGLADSATGAFKSALGIASPSKVMAGLGGHTGAGFAQGLEDTSGDVHGAASGVANAAVKGASEGGGDSGGGASKGGATVTVYVTVDGASKSVTEISAEMWSQIMQRTALESGL